MDKRLIFALALCLTSAAQFIPQHQVQVLQTLSLNLRISKYWNVSRSSCNGGNADNDFNYESGNSAGVDIYSRVSCNCSFNSSTVCHITSIQLKGLNLTGSLPVEFVNLSHLQELDLSRNLFNGSIPRAFGQLRVANLSLLGNNLTGTIPEEIGNIATLVELVLENNLLEGNLPARLGRLINLRRLLLSANNFNGTIPPEFGNLRNLKDFRIDGNAISGRVPGFIGNWNQLFRFDMQGTNIEGPIPDTISRLRNLKFLRISDLKGSPIRFPHLQNLTNLQELILRNCSINDSIPWNLGDLRGLKLLDLSFNMLGGTIPNSIQGLIENLDFLFLSHNSLTGVIPSWILNSGGSLARDLSYNNFTGSPPYSCSADSNLNLVASHSPSASTSISWCLQPDLPCQTRSDYYSLFINCGGQRTNFQGNDYAEDRNPDGRAHFESHPQWAYSNAGRFMGRGDAQFLATNDTSMIDPTDAQIYQTARLSASSIKYYGLCLRRGNYRVRLHFAEIILYDNATFNSLGRRIFDVAIQGNVVLTDFDIAKEANGVRRGIYRDFNVDVNGSTLDIHLYWTGKGTTAIPDRGYYGPLISAIAVTPNFKVSTAKGLSAGVIAAIVVSPIVVVLFILAILWKKGCLGGKEEDNELKGLDLQTGYFTLKQIKAATNNFNAANKIGEGGFGPVYKGVLSDGTSVAVKQLSSKSKQGNREFVTEIGMISALQHPNLVRLFGCCIEGKELLLIYEYLENNCLARALFGREDQRLNIDWPTRKKICIGIGKGLVYLHEESRLKIVHRDIKGTNVLLDKDLTAKISDFGLAKLDEEENTHISTRIAGTVGYMAPEYAMRGYLTDKADVYSFGIVALEIVSGRSNTNYRPKEEFVYLLDWAYVLQEQGNLLELVDPSLGSNYSKKEAMLMLNLALLCANPSPTLRPSMSSAVAMLQGKIPVQAPLVKRGADIRFRAWEVVSQESTTSGKQRGVSMDGPWIDSSVSLGSKDESHSRDSTSERTLLQDFD